MRQFEAARREAAEKIKFTYPEDLPVGRRAGEIAELWRKHQLIILGGATGSGKTTQLPKIAFSLGCGRKGRIGCTQPRRIAATAMANRLADELKVSCGGEVGFQVRFSNHCNEKTIFKFMTDGILLAGTAGDRKLLEYDCLIIDEAHERSLNIDFCLGYIKDLLPRRPDLKVAISSATLDMEEFKRFFPDAGVIEVEGRSFPVEDFYQIPEDADEELEDQVARAVKFAGELDPSGDILVFLPGEREIRDTADLLNGRNFPNTEVLMLFSRLSSQDQQKIFRPGSKRRIILATNVAETSLTIPRIRFCVDSGLARISRYNPRNRIQELHIESISRSSIRQRRGRCGRLRDGVCIHLYSEEEEKRADEFTDPEIRRTSLAGVILQMAMLRLPRIDRFPFINPPPSALVREGLRTLTDLEAITPSGALTETGRELARLPLDPHLGKMLLSGKKFKLFPELLTTVAALSVPDVRERPAENPRPADEAHRKFNDSRSDYLGMINLYNALMDFSSGKKPTHGQMRKFCRANYLNYNRMTEWMNLIDDVFSSARELAWQVKAPAGKLENIDYQLYHTAILSGIPRNVSHYDREKNVFCGVGGSKYLIFPGSALAGKKPLPEWLMSFALTETSRLFARINASIAPEYLERAVPHLLNKVYDQIHYEERSGFVRAREKLTFSGLTVNPGRRIDYSRINPRECREVFIREGLAEGRVNLPGSWVEEFNFLRDELLALEQKVRRPGTIWDGEAAIEYFMEHLPPEALSARSLKQDKNSYLPTMEILMQSQHEEILPGDYPDYLEFSGERFRLIYQFAPGEKEDGVRLLAREKQLNLLPPWALSAPVPGYRRELAEIYLRKLPRERRREFFPLRETVDKFIAAWKSGKLFTERDFAGTLAEYLNINPAEFDGVEIPPGLRCRILVLDEQGKVIRELDEVPGMRESGSKVVSRRGEIKKLTVEHSLAWPDSGRIPEKMPLPGDAEKTVYPAVTDEVTGVGKQLFLRENEARASHRAGVLRLFALQNRQQYDFLKRRIRLNKDILLGFFFHDPGKRYQDDLVTAAAEEAMGGDLWSIRSAEEFAAAGEKAIQEWGTALDDRLERLDKLQQLFAASDRLRRENRNSPGGLTLDRQLKVLFRPGFIRDGIVWEHYPRYLKGIRLRLERMHVSPARDMDKFAAVEEYFEKFMAAFAAVENPEKFPDLMEYHFLLEESLLAVFTPEIKPAVRNPLRLLPEKWEKMRL